MRFVKKVVFVVLFFFFLDKIVLYLMKFQLSVKQNSFLMNFISVFVDNEFFFTSTQQ